MMLAELPRTARASEPEEWHWVRPVDCRTAMQEMGDNNVSLIVTDPP